MHDGNLDSIKPTVITLLGLTLSDINTLLGIISLSISIIYGIYKISKETKK